MFTRDGPLASTNASILAYTVIDQHPKLGTVFADSCVVHVSNPYKAYHTP